MFWSRASIYQPWSSGLRLKVFAYTEMRRLRAMVSPREFHLSSGYEVFHIDSSTP